MKLCNTNHPSSPHSAHRRKLKARQGRVMGWDHSHTPISYTEVRLHLAHSGWGCQPHTVGSEQDRWTGKSIQCV